jgi:hypothetical protein
MAAFSLALPEKDADLFTLKIHPEPQYTLKMKVFTLYVNGETAESRATSKVRDKVLIFVMGDIPFARCVKSPARSRAFPAGGGIRIPETRPSRASDPARAGEILGCAGTALRRDGSPEISQGSSRDIPH